MTYSKLALRNARRQARDYLVYFVTVVMAAALLYAFNGLVFSQEIQTLSRMMSQLPPIIMLSSVVVVCIFGWLVSYSTRFMLSRRSRELGTYILIGLENKQVARLFFLENLMVGGCALLLGIVLGGLLYQALRAIVLAMFRQPYHFSIALSLPATGLTVAYFLLIYLHALLRSRKRIRRMKIYDLLYFDRQNEGAVIRSGKKRRWTLAGSIVLGVAGTLLLMAGSLLLGVIGAGSLIAALFSFFLSFASGVPAFFEKRPARKYQGQNLLVFRTLTAKLATMGALMATISLLLTATLLVEGSGFVFNGIFAGRAAESSCFDLYIGVGDGRDPSVYTEYIQENIPVERSLEYQVYSSGSSWFMEHLEKHNYHYYGYGADPVLRYSDYAALRTIAGYPEAELGPGEYLIHCMTYLEGLVETYAQPLTVGDATLMPGGIRTEHLSQSYGTVNGRGYILVVPDEAAEDLSVHHWAYAAKTVRPVTNAQFDDLWIINERTGSGLSSNSIISRASEEAEAAAQTTLFVFPMYFLALALSMTAATILTIQQLSEINRWRRQFVLLRKLGMARREMSRALTRQLAVYYAMPAVPPVLIAVPFISYLAHLPEPGVMVGMSSPGAIVTIALAIFSLVYGTYILLAYTSLKQSVLSELQ